ncbi:sensor histidine kinase NtrY-like [Oceanibacterium hippocampi]|uniref:sensor histidine kinase NtrY-like n=1 Tax=Oceanibacterium hippocampi TaxID=745714 RepID=UPI00111C1CCB|nr:PAS domain-containing sensor histidine kinase [Oceanibacterium hippocampi]
MRLVAWAERIGLARGLGLGLGIATFLSVMATSAALSNELPFSVDTWVIRVLLVLDLALLLLLAALIARRLVTIWAERRRGIAGSRLHTRLIKLFSIVAVAPAILVAIFTAVYFNLVVEQWFSDRVNTAVRSSVAVAEAYIQEHIQSIRADVLAMAADLNRAAPSLAQRRNRFDQVMGAQASLRNLSEAVVIDRQQNVIARSPLSFVMEVERVPPAALTEADDGDVVILTSEDDDRVRALVRLDRFIDAYLYVGRFIEPRVLNHVESTRRAVREYERLQSESVGIVIPFVLIFIVVSLLVVLVAIWFGMTLATQLVRPIIGLVDAAEAVRRGELEARVPETRTGDEMALLARTFNRMIDQLRRQRNALVTANNQIDERRRFTEAVLSGVTAGVLGLDPDGGIELINRSAVRLLARGGDELVGHGFQAALPEMAELLKLAGDRHRRYTQDQITIVINGSARNLLVRVAAQRDGEKIKGYVVTFDDVTELVSAQRMAAWGDVARRIAHEIKNPLTPIQLSAERLRRRYLKEIESDPAVFAQCIETIIRHVGDIGRMVDEFSSFARMPAPVFKAEDVGQILRQTVLLQRIARPDIEFRETLPGEPLVANCDGRQLSQVLTNLLQNAVDAIDERQEGDSGAPPGEVELSLFRDREVIAIEVADNGCGLPVDERERLTEPYVTKKEKGTGLGLAIVKKIMEEHGGDISLKDRDGTGAVVRLALPVPKAEDGNESGNQQDEKQTAYGA